MVKVGNRVWVRIMVIVRKLELGLHILVCVLGLKLGVSFGLELALVIRLGFCLQLGSRLGLG